MTAQLSSPAPESEDRHQGGIQVIARMSKIMRALSAHAQPCGMSLAAIAAQVDLPRSTVQRIITALVAENIVEPAGPSGFRIGPAVGQILYQTHSDIVPLLKPHVETLSLQLQETVCVARLQGFRLHIVESVVGEQMLRVVPQLGITPPLQITAAGKVLLSRLDDEALQAWLAQERRSGRPLADTLPEEIRSIRQLGYATDQDEVVQGVGAIAVAVDTYRGAYAITILSPSARMQTRIGEYRQALFALQRTLDPLLGVPA